MSIDNISGVSGVNPVTSTGYVSPVTAAGNKTNTANTAEVDTYEKYNSRNAKVDSKKLNELIAQSKKETEAFRQMIEKLLIKQGTTAEKALADISAGKEVIVEIDEETRAEAKKAISEDGYYGVKQTSERILDFAAAYAGKDSKKIDTMQRAFEEGFKAATEAWGEKDMPQISKDTYDAVMKGFEELREKATR